MVSGQQKATNKSTTVNGLSLLMAAGASFGSLIAPAPRRVWIWQQEGGHAELKLDLQAQINGMHLTTASVSDNIRIAHQQPHTMTSEDDWGETADDAAEFAPDLMVFDPLAQVQTGDENSAVDMAAFATALHDLQSYVESKCDRKPTVLLITHLNKTEGKQKSAHPDLQVRGSTFLPSWYDKHIALRNYSLKDPTISVVLLDKFAARLEYSLVWQREMRTVRIPRADGTVRLQKEPVKLWPSLVDLNREDYTDLLQLLQTEEGYTPRSLRKLWNIDDRSYRKVIGEMQRAGSIEKDSGDGLYYLNPGE